MLTAFRVPSTVLAAQASELMEHQDTDKSQK